MKPAFESKTHQALLEQRLFDQTAVRFKQITGDRAARILGNTLTKSERQERRKKAKTEHPELF